jgi:hypothetical protein
MKFTMQWGVRVQDENKNNITVDITPSKPVAEARAAEIGGKLVRVRCLS